MPVSTSLLEYVWLWDVRHGWTVQEIARREGFSPRRIRQGIARARGGTPDPGDTAENQIKRPPRLSPLFPVVGLTRSSVCPHKRRIRLGSILCCMICHKSGLDHHPALERNKATDPKPEPKVAVLPEPPRRGPSETRRQRRARIFGAKRSA
jgi:hypothetical protein